MNQVVATKNRIYWIDWAKSIAICLMVWGHISPVLQNQIYMFHMPLLFMISGYLYRRKERTEELRSILFSLYIPYLIYNIIYMLPLPLGGGYRFGFITYVLLGNSEQLYPVMCPLWFLVSLIMMRLACVARIDMRFLITAGVVLSVLLNGNSWGLENDYFQLRTTLLAIPFFIVGYYMKQHNISAWVKKQNKYAFSAVCTVLFLSIMVLARNEEQFNLFHCCTGSSVFSFYLATILLSVIVLSLCQLLLDKHNKIIEKISNGTLLILAFHQVIFWNVPRWHLSAFLHSLISLVIILFISYWLILFAERYCPILIGKRNRIK